jgi:(p)ppGpp synthase/HD superfamily hydrolase
MSTLEKAIALAATQHAGQLDKGGQPYILHPLRLMLQFSILPYKSLRCCMTFWKTPQRLLKT